MNHSNVTGVLFSLPNEKKIDMHIMVHFEIGSCSVSSLVLFGKCSCSFILCMGGLMEKGFSLDDFVSSPFLGKIGKM